MVLDQSVGQFALKTTETVNENETLGFLITEMEKHRFRRFPVVNDNKEAVGMVTSSDILGALHRIGDSSFLKLPISEVMSDKIVVVQHTDTLRSVIEIMYNIGISGIPVMKDGAISGIITEKDILLIDGLWREIPDKTITNDDGPGRLISSETIVTEQYTFWQIADRLVTLAQRQVLVKDSVEHNYLGIITIMTLLSSLLSSITISNPNFDILQTLSPVDMTMKNIFQRSSPMLVSSARLWMNSRGLEAFPIFHRGQAVKLVTEKDIFGYLANNL